MAAQLDWQALITFAIGAIALAYVARRWWPRRTGAQPGTCGTPAQGACQSGCGSCGSGGGTPARDHTAPTRPGERPVTLVRPAAQNPPA